MELAMRFGLLCLAVCGGIGLAGCGNTGAPATAALGRAAADASGGALASDNRPPPKPTSSIPAGATPDQVVAEFLSALKGGDKATTAALLTAKAWEETSKHNIEVDPQSAPNAQYQVQAAQYLPDNPSGAHVTSVWTEVYDDGNVTYQIVWVLRREQDGWRIAGMALELVPGQDLAFLNFEDPADMMKKRDEAIAAMEPPAAETAAQPTGPGQIPATPIER
jgi:hypothetical protein